MKHFLILAFFLLPFADAEEVRPNVLLITVDDMSADSLGCFGCKLKDTSPCTDQLARESLRFQHAPRLRRQLLPQPQRHVLRALPAQQWRRRILPHQKQIPHSLRHPEIKRLLHRHPRQGHPFHALSSLPRLGPRPHHRARRLQISHQRRLLLRHLNHHRNHPRKGGQKTLLP